MKSKRSRTYLVSGLTLALIFVAIILVFRDVLPDIVKDLSTVPFWGVLLLLALGFAYEAMESVLCLVIIHHKKPDCTFIDALRVTFLGVFGNITTLGAGTLPMQSFYLYRRGLDAGSGLGIMASEYVLHKISVLIYATVALLLGGDWLEQSASGLARYLLIGYVIGALIVIALTLLYTWDKVLKLVLMPSGGSTTSGNGGAQAATAPPTAAARIPHAPTVSAASYRHAAEVGALFIGPPLFPAFGVVVADVFDAQLLVFVLQHPVCRVALFCGARRANRVTFGNPRAVRFRMAAPA